MTTLLTTSQLQLRVATRTLCQDLSQSFAAGQRWAILGVNGAGKTTLLHTLAGLRLPQQGEVHLGQQPINQLTRRVISQQIAVLLQDAAIPLGGRALDYVLLGRHPHLARFAWENNTDVQIALDALHCVDLDQIADRDITTLSGGERQRLAIALVLTQQTPILLLDEPVNHLDIRHQHQILTLLSQLALQQHKLLIMTLHDVNLARRYCDHVLLIFANGEVQAGTTASLLNSATLSRLYDYPVELLETAAGTVVVPA